LFSLGSNIKPNNPQNYSAFGSQVAIAGTYAAVKTTYGGKGKVSIYSKSGSTWSLLTEIANTVANSNSVDNMQ
jgi:chaperonin GroEL (HSP60 family)